MATTKYKCVKCGCLWRRNPDETWSQWDLGQEACAVCDNSPAFLSSIEPVVDDDATQPGLTQAADGSISIGPGAAKASQERAQTEALENAQGVVSGINDETTKAGDSGTLAEGNQP